MESHVASWRAGIGGTVAVTANPGRGLDAFVAAFVAEHAADRPIALSIDTRTASPRDLETKIAGALGVASGGREALTEALAKCEALIVVTDLHLLFERRVGGFGAVTRLPELIAGAPRALWVLASDAIAYDFLRWAAPDADLGTHRVRVPAFTTADADALLRTVTERWRLGLTEKPDADRLSDLARGAPGGILFRFLASLTATGGDDGVLGRGDITEIAPADLPPDAGALRRALAAVLLHGGLAVTGLAAVLDLRTAEARYLLQQLEQLGWLRRTPGAGSSRPWRVHPVAGAAAAAAMRAANLLPATFGDV